MSEYDAHRLARMLVAVEVRDLPPPGTVGPETNREVDRLVHEALNHPDTGIIIERLAGWLAMALSEHFGYENREAGAARFLTAIAMADEQLRDLRGDQE